MTTGDAAATLRKLGSRQIEVLRLMATNSGGSVPLSHNWRGNGRIAATLAKYGLVEDRWHGEGEPLWQITVQGRIVAERSRADRPELCFRCDKRPAVFVQFSGAQSGREIGYPDAHLICQHCYDEDREHFPTIKPSRIYRMVPVEAA